MVRELRVLVLWCALLVCSNCFAVCSVGDLDGDCVVDSSDLLMLAQSWLKDESPNDLDGTSPVDLYDLILLSGSWNAQGLPIVINEFVASNSTGITDESGSYEDWIEIYNPSDDSVDIGGAYFSDDPEEPLKWQIPAGQPEVTTIAAGGYMIIWADSDPDEGPLHLDLKLSADGESIIIYAPNGETLVDRVDFSSQDTDISSGRYPDITGLWQKMPIPTPAFSNEEGFEGEVADVQFSVEGGFADASFDLTLSTLTPDASIYYTLNGSEPTAWDTLYTSPINISASACVRARALRENWKPSAIGTNSYIFLSSVATQTEPQSNDWPHKVDGVYVPNGQVMSYSMEQSILSRYSQAQFETSMRSIATISLVTDPGNLFDADTGIYVNAYNRGIEWERPVSVEMINPDGSRAFHIDGGLRIRGGASRSYWNPKHSLRLFFRSEYGKSTLQYPMFGDEGVDEFEKIDLRTAQNYSWNFENDSRNTFLREVFTRDLQGDMGRPYTRSRYCHVYLNGLYWGLYMTQERPDAEYAVSYFGGSDDDYDVVKRNNTGTQDIEATDGTLESWHTLWDKVQYADFSNNDDYFEMQGLDPNGLPDPSFVKYLDVENLADYMVSIFFTGDKDAPVSAFMDNNRPNNFFMIFNRENPDGFKIIRHDGEHTLDTGETDRTGPFPAGGNLFMYSNPQWLHQKLAANREYRLKFADSSYRAMRPGGVMSEAACYQRFDERKEQIIDAIIAEATRWGKGVHDKTEWLGAVQTARDFFIGRSEIVIQQLKDRGWYPNIEVPQVFINGQFQYGGYIDPAATLTFAADSGSVYYTLDGTDPRKMITADDYLQEHDTILFDTDAVKKVFVPSEANGGYDMICGPSGFNVEFYRSSSPVTNVSIAREVINEPAVQLDFQADVCPTINYINGGSDAHFADGRNFPGCEDGSDIDNAVMLITAKVYIPQAGAWTFGVNSDDGFEAVISGFGVSKTFAYYYGRGPGDTFGVLDVPQSGYYDVEIVYFENGGGGEVEFFAVQGSYSSFTSDFKLVGDTANGGLEVFSGWAADGFDDTGWQAGTGGIGYDTGSDYQSFIGIDLFSQMYQQQTSAFIRIPFSCDKSAIENLIFEAGCDDGFVAYLNGMEILRVNVDDQQQLSPVSAAYSASEYTVLQSYDITQWKNLLHEGTNVIAVQAMNVSAGSSDMLFNCRLLSSTAVIGQIASGAMEYTGAVALSKSCNVKARAFDGSQWSALCEAVFAADISSSLRVSELMYNPAASDAEFVELVNISGQAINLDMVAFTEGIDFTFGDTVLAPGQMVLIVESVAGFEAAYGTGYNIAGVYDGSLSNGGEQLVIQDVLGNEIQRFEYSDDWYPITDDGGFSLTKIDPSAAGAESWGQKQGWMPSSVSGGSPGAADTGILPGTIVINEVLAHSHSTLPDWIELHNTGASDVSIEGWFLSDDQAAADKYQIVSDDENISGMIPAGGYVVFYQDTSFGAAFGLSEAGEEVCLSSGVGGVVTGYREVEDFSGSLNGVTFGRYEASAGDWDFVPMQSPTPGAVNSQPLIPDVVISEIMYNPLDGGVEYVRLTNTSAAAVSLYDGTLSAGWKFTNGFDYEFPAASVISAGASVYVTDDPVVFAQLYPSVGPAAIFGPFADGKLSNGGETVEISFPGGIDDGTGLPYYVIAEKIKYSDESPWPESADGDGDSLGRIDNYSYGSDPANWQALSH